MKLFETKKIGLGIPEFPGKGKVDIKLHTDINVIRHVPGKIIAIRWRICEKKPFLYIAFIVSSVQTFSAVTVAARMTEQAKEMAQKDYRSAMAKIKLANEAEMLECAKRRGPAAKACEIQTNGRRAAAEDQAKLTRDDAAGTEPPASDVERQKAAKNQARVAKTSYGMDKARITAENKQALFNAKSSSAKNGIRAMRRSH